MLRKSQKFFIFTIVFVFLFLTDLSGNFVQAAADPYPERQIRIIVAHGVGGGADRQARSVQRYLPDILKVPVLVENHSGAGTKIGTKLFLKEPADGYTLFSFHQPSITELIKKDPTVAKLDDFGFININWIDPSVWIVHKDLGWKTMDDMVDAVKKNPNKYSFSTSGAGTSGDVLARMFCAKLGLQIRIAHFDGGGKARLAVKGRHVDMTAGGAERLIDVRDDVVALAHFWDEPVPLWPEAKPINEVLAKYNVKMARDASISGFAVRKEIQKEYPDRWNTLVNAFNKLTTEHKEYQEFCDKAQIGRVWLGPEKTLELVKEVDDFYRGEETLKR